MKKLILFTFIFILLILNVNSVETPFTGYQFEEGTGFNALDSIINFNGTHNSVYVSSFGNNGTGSYGLNLNGTNENAIILDNSNFTFGDGATDQPFTITAWINMVDASAFRIVAKGESTADGEFIFGFSGGDQLQLRTVDDSSGGNIGQRTVPTYTTSESQWIHVAGTYNGNGATSGFTIYVNGVVVSSTAVSGGAYTAVEDSIYNVTIGAWTNSFGEGSIDEVFFFKSELNVSDILEVYNNGFDFIAPIITDETINNTFLNCSESVRFTANVTDNFIINSTNFDYTDNLGFQSDEGILLSGNIYYIDVTYTHNTGGLNETYTFNNVTSIDTQNNSAVSNPNINYVYNCLIPDITNPIIQTPLNPTVDKITQNLTTEANCTDNYNISSFSMMVYNSSDFIFNTTNISTITETRLQIHDFVDLTTIATGSYTRNTSCFDNAGNSDFIQDNVLITDTSPPIITNIKPVNNSQFEVEELIFNEPISHNWSTNTVSSCVINFSHLDSLESTTAQMEHSLSIVYTNNKSTNWFINCTTDNSTLFVVSDTLKYNITFTKPFRVLTMSDCPTTLSSSILLIFMVGLGLSLMLIGIVSSIGMFGLFGSIILFVSSWYLYPCVTIIGFLVGGFSLICIIYFAFAKY